ncbi:MAG: Hpt domain-containing protein [Taibaiella sp.]|nr:Hpt domain-containing protein [Taibaiella sp.]
MNGEELTTQANDESLIDFSFLYEISYGDASCFVEIIDIFLTSVPDAVRKLHDLIHDTDDWEETSRQAHFIKSSVSVVKVRDMYDTLGLIEKLAKEKRDKDEMVRLFGTVEATLNESYPVLEAEKVKNVALM